MKKYFYPLIKNPFRKKDLLQAIKVLKSNNLGTIKIKKGDVFIKEFPNTLPNAFNMKIKDFAHMYKAVDLKRFFKPETNHYDFVIKENMIVSPNDPHPSVKGHTQWAKQLKEFIDANNLRTI